MVLQPFSPKVKTSFPRCTHSLDTFSPAFTKKESLTLLLQYSLLVSLRQKVRKRKIKSSEALSRFLLHLEFSSLLSFDFENANL